MEGRSAGRDTFNKPILLSESLAICPLPLSFARPLACKASRSRANARLLLLSLPYICMRKECRVWTIKDNYRLGDDIQSKVLAFGLSAEIERETP